MEKKKNNCPEGWHTGECCCNCRNQIELFKHPSNIINNGSIGETTNMYACIAPHDCDDSNNGVIFEKKHGFCEMYFSRLKL